MNPKLSTLALLGAALLTASAAQAQTAGTLSARLGAMQISPSVTSGDLSPPAFPHTTADVGNASQLAGGVNYTVDDHWAIDVPLALPFKHNIYGDGAIAGVGKIGETKALPITVFAQYRFGEANAKVRPYVGAGPTYAKFFKERSTNTLTALTGGTPSNPTTLSIESKLVPTVQFGVTLMLNDRWFIDAVAAKTWLKTRTTLSTGQTLDIKLNPTTVGIMVGYRF
ncbi:outer membrane protein [Tibeticola sediminis]|uniref:Outer membrane protein n=1 Tax=Tibeticola sediminis TaxID=1917811 RepID=A0A3N4U727_9BURK|nr:OmpW family outer membrane protein [Tibeticola sediminis]RPE62901.1 outer membrane protein [Tibeticola sediminis]